MAPDMVASRLPSPSSWRCSGVSESSASAINAATLPTSVDIPIAVTTHTNRPWVTWVFIITIVERSPNGASTATDTIGSLGDGGRLTGQ